MFFLGLSSLAHDTAAALLDDSGFRAAIEESKLERDRRTAGVPREAIRFCLHRAGIRSNDLRAVAVASKPWRCWSRRASFHARYLPLAPVSSGYYLSKALGELARDLNHLRMLRLVSGDAPVPVLALDHHLCHAASAFFASPFERALVVSMDEQGDGQSGIVAVGEGGAIAPIESVPFPHSLAWVYSQVTELLGFRPREHEHKTQWLSLTAEPALADLFLRVMRRSSGPFPKLDSSYFQRGFSGQLAFSAKFYREAKILGAPNAGLDGGTRSRLSSSLERACETILVDFAESLRKRHGIPYLCLAGGLFLNPLLVRALEKQSGFAQIFVQPAAGNEGTALGAAWLAQRKFAAPRGREKASGKGLASLYLGPSFSNEEIKQVLDNCKAPYRWLASDAQRAEETVKLLGAGKIVAWCQGAAEFGPRALGNRSLIASPWAPFVKENLNDFVKHREPFRPFALSVPEEDAAKYFEFSPAARFMASMGSLRPEYRELLSAHTLPGALVRLHVVSRADNSLFWSLLKSFGQRAPAPVLLNTSFNLFGEPLVLSPRDAVRSYFCSGTDALVLGNFLLTKS